jgi:hypothetical protein
VAANAGVCCYLLAQKVRPHAAPATPFSTGIGIFRIEVLMTSIRNIRKILYIDKIDKILLAHPPPASSVAVRGACIRRRERLMK